MAITIPPKNKKMDKSTESFFGPENLAIIVGIIVGTIAISVMIITTFVSPYVIYYHVLTFDEPDIWYLECSMYIDKNHKNYNKSNPLDLCNELTESGHVGSLNPVYPIKDVRNYCFTFITVVTSVIFLLSVVYCMGNPESVGVLASLLIFFIVMFGNLIIRDYGKNNNEYQKCHLLEDTFSYLESDKDNEFPDFKTITSDECEDFQSSIPRWIFIFPPINHGILGILGSLGSLCLCLTRKTQKERDRTRKTS